MTERKIRVGLVGANPTHGWGGKIHGPVYSALPETDLVAVCTSSTETAKASAEKFGARYSFTDYREMVQLEEVDLVSIALRVDMHLPIAMAALEAGKPVICEWPLAVTSQDAEAMYDFAKKRGLGHAVVLQEHTAPVVMYLNELVANGYIGQPWAINMTYFRDSALIQNTSKNEYLRELTGGGSALAIATGHALHALTRAFGELDSLCADVDTLQKEVTLLDTGEHASVKTPDNVAFVGRFKNGAMATAQVSWTARPALGWQVFAYGTDGCIVASRGSGDVRPGGSVLMGSQSGEPLRPLAIPDKYNWTPEFAPNTAQFPVAQLVRSALHDFANGREAHPNFQDAARLHRLLEDIVRSSQTRQWVSVS
jgi:predicted dehydrogenase